MGEVADRYRALAAELAQEFSRFPRVRAIALGGSQTSGVADKGSDIDLYVFNDAPIPVADRVAIIEPRASYTEIDNQFFGPGDEFVDAASGIAVDVVYFGASWLDEQLDRVLSRHEAAIGYTTCVWYTALHCEPLYDRYGWFAALQKRAQSPYPDELRQAIVAHNYPLLRGNMSSFYHQIEKALSRDDANSVNHRLAALLASYFDILFAVNYQPHPGEKRLVNYAQRLCAKLPQNFAIEIAAILAACGGGQQDLLPRLDRLLDSLDDLLGSTGLLAVTIG